MLDPVVFLHAFRNWEALPFISLNERPVSRAGQKREPGFLKSETFRAVPPVETMGRDDRLQMPNTELQCSPLPAHTHLENAS